MSKDLADDIQAMHDYIERNGWTQGNYYANHPDDGLPFLTPAKIGPAACLLGAESAVVHYSRADNVTEHLTEMIEARGDIPPRVSIPGCVYDVIPKPGTSGKVGQHYTTTIPYFNDYVLKTKAEVLEFLEKARIAAEEKA